METIQIESINCRGLRDKMKRIDIFEKAREERINILCLQETHIMKEDMNILKNEWNVNFFISGKEKNSGGVLIAIENNFEHKIHNTKYSDNGRFIILDIEVIDIARFLLINMSLSSLSHVPNFQDILEQPPPQGASNKHIRPWVSWKLSISGLGIFVCLFGSSSTMQL